MQKEGVTNPSDEVKRLLEILLGGSQNVFR